jgi:hypothetical protein
VQVAVDAPELFRFPEGGLGLTQNLRLSEHERVEARRHPEEMIRRFEIPQDIDLIGDLRQVEIPQGAREPEEKILSVHPVVNRKNQFRPIARRQHHALPDAWLIRDKTERLGQTGRRDRDALPNLNRAAVKTDAAYHAVPDSPTDVGFIDLMLSIAFSLKCRVETEYEYAIPIPAKALEALFVSSAISVSYWNWTLRVV